MFFTAASWRAASCTNASFISVSRLRLRAKTDSATAWAFVSAIFGKVLRRMEDTVYMGAKCKFSTNVNAVVRTLRNLAGDETQSTGAMLTYRHVIRSFSA